MIDESIMIQGIALLTMLLAGTYLLTYVFWAYPNVGLGLIIVVPGIYIANTAIGYLYFRLVKNKTMLGKILTLTATLLVTLFFYSEHYGSNRHIPVLFRMLSGDFGNVAWARENTRTDDMQTVSDELFEFQLERVQQNTPLSSAAELWLFTRDLSSGTEYRIRLDDVMNEAELPRGSNVLTPYWSSIQSIDEATQRYLLTTTSDFSSRRRWVFEINMENQTANLLEQIHVAMLGRTDDDKFIAHLYMVNFFDDENRSVRLAMRDVETGERIHIPIDIDVAEIAVRNFDSGWDLLRPAVWATDEETSRGYVTQPPKWVVEIVLTDTPMVYTVLLREGFLVSGRKFELDMNLRKMRELL